MRRWRLSVLPEPASAKPTARQALAPPMLTGVTGVTGADGVAQRVLRHYVFRTGAPVALLGTSRWKRTQLRMPAGTTYAVSRPV